jgi:hypothetical protein
MTNYFPQTNEGYEDAFTFLHTLGYTVEYLKQYNIYSLIELANQCKRVKL